VANSSTFSGISTGLFVTTNNTVYATGFNLPSVLVWLEGSVSTSGTIFADLNSPFRVFVTTNGDVYADNGNVNHRVEKWANGAANSTAVMFLSGRCNGLSVDVYNSLYCSLWSDHLVLKKSLDSHTNVSTTVAGNGTAGSLSNMFSYPCGIFVDIDLSLYVADFGNDRVQLFRFGQSNGTTVAGTGAPDTVALNRPTQVILDGDDYLFIADQGNSRIVGSGVNGFRCIAGCSGTSGSAVNQLLLPYDLSFDSQGNLFVTDAHNNRLQKFILARNSCGELCMTLL
jgi:hypothetical protein